MKIAVSGSTLTGRVNSLTYHADSFEDQRLLGVLYNAARIPGFHLRVIDPDGDMIVDVTLAVAGGDDQ